MNILEQIAESRRQDVAAKRQLKPLDFVAREAEELAEAELDRGKPQQSNLPGGEDTTREDLLAGSNGFPFPFEKALAKPGISFICEAKKASPSKGLIASDFPYLEIARDYETGGAAAISVLTEPHHFLGEDRYLREISEAVAIPTLRKDFAIDDYLIYEAKTLGAAAVLVIVALLDDKTLAKFIAIAHRLGLSALVEAHDKTEIHRGLDAGARIIGVNNRDLRTFEVDFENSERLRSEVPRDVLFVGESGVKSRADVERLEAAGEDAVLIGETLMRAPDRVATLKVLRGEGSGK